MCLLCANTLYEYLIVPVVVLDIQGSGPRATGTQIAAADETEEIKETEGKVDEEGVEEGVKEEVIEEVQREVQDKEVLLRNEGTKSMMLLAERKRRLSTASVSRGGSVPKKWRKGSDDDEDSGTDKKSDHDDDDYRRKWNEHVKI